MAEINKVPTPITLLITMFLGLAFTILPNWDGVTYMEPDPFLFHDFGYAKDGRRLGICYQTYIHMICGFLIVIIYAWEIDRRAKKYLFEIRLFFFLCCFDLVDYLFTYNTMWGHIWIIPISFNTISITLYSFVVAKAMFQEYVNQ